MVQLLAVASQHLDKLTSFQEDTVVRLQMRISRMAHAAYTTGTERRVIAALEKKLASEIKDSGGLKKIEENPTKAMCARIREEHGL